MTTLHRERSGPDSEITLVLVVRRRRRLNVRSWHHCVTIAADHLHIGTTALGQTRCYRDVCDASSEIRGPQNRYQATCPAGGVRPDCRSYGRGLVWLAIRPCSISTRRLAGP